MAGNKMNTKGKGKEDKGKASKPVDQNTDSNDDLDFALLRKPILTSITGFAQARKIFDLATEELKDLLSNECDLLYECKVCRNIFRSLANFISHKRVYCKEKFTTSTHGHFINTISTANEILKIKRTEEGYLESLKDRNEAESMETDDVDDDRIPLSKDLTAIVEKIAKTKGVFECNMEDQQVVLQKIPSSNVAVFQNLEFDSRKDSDKMRAQVNEIDAILSRDKAVLQDNGKFTIESSKDKTKTDVQDSDSVIQISDDDETYDSENLKCKICDLQFSTQKTLKFHMKYKHLESRLVFPCPDCLEIFSTSWSVYRHLFKVHRKTAAQIRRLRESIQAKAFRMNNPPAFYEKRKKDLKGAAPVKLTEEERMDQENQEWIEKLEWSGGAVRCGGCGRAFERRAALHAHANTCRRRDPKRIAIQIRKDYNKEPAPVTGLTILRPEHNDTKIIKEDNVTTNNNLSETQNEEENNDIIENGENELEEATMQIIDDEKSNDSSESVEKVSNAKPEVNEAAIKTGIKLPFAMQAEKSNLAAFRQRILTYVVISKLLCKKCDTKFDTSHELYDHMADHFQWVRYACKLCNFRHYLFEKLPEHVKEVHKLKGDSDFYYSTVKAIDGTEAMIISKCLESEPDDTNDANEVSPTSRRLSRCSSDSSRLSDDSSSSNTLKENTTRKRKINQNKSNAKKKKETVNDDADDSKDGDRDSVSNSKTFEENSSDVDESEDKNSKNQNEFPTVTSRRPIRKKTKRKNEDFEYDLSNLLKMEAQGYRDSQTVTVPKSTTVTAPKLTTVTAPKPTTVTAPKSTTVTAPKSSNAVKPYPNKKKGPQESINSDSIDKDFVGALMLLSRKAVGKGAAHMMPLSVAVYSQQREERIPIFVKPMLPKVSRSDKHSPKKDATDESSSTKATKIPEKSQTKDIDSTKTPIVEDAKIPENVDTEVAEIDELKAVHDDNTVSCADKSSSMAVENKSETAFEKIKTNSGVQAMVPIKFRRQSLDLMKNPLINKNIKDFSKAGMKTKILVIKPIHRNKDGTQTVKTPFKFQTIKLKDPNKDSSSSENKPSNQVVVVEVPKIPCSSSDGFSTNSDTPAVLTKINNVDNIDHVNSDKPLDSERNETIDTDAILTENRSDKETNCAEVNEESDAEKVEAVSETDNPELKTDKPDNVDSSA